jgi:hypothetical protein
MTCPNCKKVLSCGCQKKTASNGKNVCASCAASYEVSLKASQKNNTASSIMKTVIK